MRQDLAVEKCVECAERNGHTVVEADLCENGSVGCPDCPFLESGESLENDAAEAEMYADGGPLHRITDLMGAESEMERLAVLEARKATVEAHAKEVLEKKAFEVEMWKKAQLEQVEREVEYREALLAGYLDKVGEKSIAVVAGRFRYRKVGEKLKVVDEAAARMWLKVQAEPDMFLSKPKVREVLPSALQKHLKAVGEIPDGCEIEPEGRKFEVDLV